MPRPATKATSVAARRPEVPVMVAVMAVVAILVATVVVAPRRLPALRPPGSRRLAGLVILTTTSPSKP